jgi:phosphoribosylformimino-5-aminoimidazole carboxamide ribotide isomerase
MEIRNVPLSDVWPIRQAVMYPSESIDFVKLEDDDRGIHFGLYSGEQLVSVISLFVKGDEVQFRKFATVKDLQGKGYGSRLLRYVMEWAAAANTKVIWCNARKAATGIYKKFGMQESGSSWKKYGIDFIKMTKTLRDADHSGH